MGASAISGVCNLAPPILPNHRERDHRKLSVCDHEILNRMLKHGRNSESTLPEVHHVDQATHCDMHTNVNERVCSCGMESASSHFVSTSGQSRQVSVAMSGDSLASTHRKLQKTLHMMKDGKKSGLRPTPVQNISKEQRYRGPSKKWGTDEHMDGTEDVTRMLKRRAALVALAAAGFVSLSQPLASATELSRVDFLAPMTGVEALEAKFNESIYKQLQNEIQIQRKEWGLTSVSTTAPSPTQNQQSQYVASVSTSGDDTDATELKEEDPFHAWKQVQKEIEFEGEKCAVPVTRPPVQKPTLVKKVVAASVAVAVAGSVAGAASHVATHGGSAVATSLTVLQHSGPPYLPGSSLLGKIIQHLGGGGVAGAVGATVVYPLDTIKTRMQAQSTEEGVEPLYKDEIDCLKQLVVKEGPASLYSGLVPQLIGIAPEKAMKLTVNEALLSSLEAMMPGARVWALEFIAGGGGGASQVVFTNPMEIVKVRLQTQKEGLPKKALWTIVKELGVKGLYEGAGVTLARDVPSSAIFFACYTLLRQYYPDQSFLAGAIASIPATIVVTPMDIIKTRLQKEPAPGELKYTDWWECLQDIVNNEGPQALFKGSLLRVLRTSPQFGITLMLYGMICEGS